MSIQAGETTFYQANRGIIQDGLVLNLDAGVEESYNGGTTWTDLAGGNNGTLENGPTFDAGNGGSIVFDGSNDYVSFSTSPLTFSSSNFSVECIFRTTTDAVDVMMGHGPTGGGGGDWWLGVNGNGKLQFSISLPIYKIEPQTSSTVNDNEWKTGLATINNSTYEVKLYLNGSLSDTRSGTGSYPNTGTSLSVGKFGSSSFNFPGDIACTRIYNRVLSAAEILQNFNAMKHRFGI